MARERKSFVKGTVMAGVPVPIAPHVRRLPPAAHPCLVALVHLLARQAATEDIKRQRLEGGPL